MSWNYRVIRHVKNNEEFYHVHEVYYDDNGTPTMVSTEPIAPYAESVEDLKWVLERMLEALDKPILDYEYFKNKD